MKYSEYIAENRAAFWSSSQAKYINNKIEAKKLARKMGIRCPADYENVVVKPTNESTGRNVMLLPMCKNLMCEEYIPHDIDYRLFVFDNNEIPIVQTDICVQTDVGTKITKYSYWDTRDWTRIDIDKDISWQPEMFLPVERPNCYETMVEYALRMKPHFSLPLRVDFFINQDNEVIFNEMCVTPGLVVADRITSEADEWLGSFINI